MQWRFWGFHFWGHWGDDTFIWGGHTTNTFALNYRVCNVILASSGLILNFFGGQSGARNFTGGCSPPGPPRTCHWMNVMMMMMLMFQMRVKTPAVTNYVFPDGQVSSPVSVLIIHQFPMCLLPTRRHAITLMLQVRICFWPGLFTFVDISVISWWHEMAFAFYVLVSSLSSFLACNSKIA